MINQLLGKVFGTKNERVVKALMPKVVAINALEPQIEKLTDAELRAKTEEFRQRIQERMSRFGGGGSQPAEGPNGVESEDEGGLDREPERLRSLFHQAERRFHEVDDVRRLDLCV